MDEDEQLSCVQSLLEAARGVSLILSSIGEDPHIESLDSILFGLSAALRRSADLVCANYFRNAGTIADSLAPNVLTALLRLELGKVEQQRKFKRAMGRAK